MRKAFLIFLSFAFSGMVAYPQIGGRYAFEFVNLPNNAHVAGLGGVNVSLYDQDVNLMFQNPALLNSQMDKKIGLNYIPYMADIKATSLSYAKSYNENTTFGAGLQFTHYGKMDWTDESGQYQGIFTPFDVYMVAGASHTKGVYTMGASMKFAASRINTLGASAIMTDLGGLFKHPTKDFTVGLTIKNLGVPIKKYTPGTFEPLPFDVQLGTSFKPQHMPVRISITAHNLNKFDIAYKDPNVKGPLDLEGNEIKEKISVGEKIGRHFTLGGELILSKNFHLMAGYNYLRRRELRLQTKSGGAGFSFGGMIRVKAFEIAFSRAIYHVAGGSNYLTIITDMNRLIPSKKKITNTDGNN